MVLTPHEVVANCLEVAAPPWKALHETHTKGFTTIAFHASRLSKPKSLAFSPTCRDGINPDGRSRNASAPRKFVSCYRVRSGLGLDAQKEAVQQRLDGGRWQLVAEFVEID